MTLMKFVCYLILVTILVMICFTTSVWALLDADFKVAHSKLQLNRKLYDGSAERYAKEPVFNFFLNRSPF